MLARRTLIAVLTCACALGLGLRATPATARDAVVPSFDGTPIAVHFFTPPAPPPGGRAPTVVVGSTYPSAGETRAEQDVGDRIGLATLRSAGYNVLTFDPRGLGGSGGSIMFASPAFEARDARAIVDFVAGQPEAQLDAPGDPRIGMSGTSYGAGIQLLTAALDQRVDAIVPDMGWHSLATALHRDGAVKTGWLAALCGLDVVAGAVEGKATADNVRPLTASPELKAACVEGVAGAPSEASAKWLADHGPGRLVTQIRAPALITQGTQDTLFSLSEAIANHGALRDSGVPVKMIWYCGGHVPCPGATGDPGHLRRAGLAWLNRWLRADPAVDTGPAFEWQTDDGTWRSGPDFPFAGAGTLDTVGSGSLKIAARYTPALGLGRSALPARNAVEARFPAPSEQADVLGTPRVRLIYRGRAKPASTHLYAQVVDADGKRVAGGQATPLPVTLDGRVRKIDRRLEALALRADERSSLRLQITAGAATYELQRSRGTVSVYGASASLPLVDATQSARAAPARTSRRPRAGVRIRQRDGRSVRLAVRARFPSRPCRGSIDFLVSTRQRPYVVNARLRRGPCRASATLRARARGGTRIRITARFNGNATLKPRSSETITARAP